MDLLAYNRSPSRFAPYLADLRCRCQSRPYRLDPETRVASIHAGFNLPLGLQDAPLTLSERLEIPPTLSATFPPPSHTTPISSTVETFSTKSTGDIPNLPLEWPSPAWARLASHG